MTKFRAPGTFDAALDRISGVFPNGKRDLPEIVGRTLATIYQWGNPEDEGSMPIACAVKLDVAYRQRGGIGSPMRDAYDVLLDQHCADLFSDQYELAHATAEMAKEIGDANHAAILATLPEAGESEFAAAEREALQGASAVATVVAIVRRLRRPSASPPPEPPP